MSQIKLLDCKTESMLFSYTFFFLHTRLSFISSYPLLSFIHYLTILPHRPPSLPPSLSLSLALSSLLAPLPTVWTAAVFPQPPVFLSAASAGEGSPSCKKPSSPPQPPPTLPAWLTPASEHDLKMSSPPATSAETACPPLEELECKICYQRYNANNRKPKILDCLHRVCSRCLVKILDVTDGAGCVPCPFCRHQTEITEYQVSALPDDVNIMSHLTTREKFCSLDKKREVVLTPKSLSSTSPSRDSSNCLVITIMEVQRDLQRSPSHNGSSDIYADQSLDSVSIGSNGPTDHDALSKLCNHVPRILRSSSVFAVLTSAVRLTLSRARLLISSCRLDIFRRNCCFSLLFLLSCSSTRLKVRSRFKH
uniref:E3 ubiquitin-protein ligase RNF182 n=1 Tax=Poecilia reticulata TaxID=8081 RepID=A0A3P9N7L5_POERE